MLLSSLTALKGNGLHIFIFDGEVTIQGERLYHPDGMGIWNSDGCGFQAHEQTEILVMEIPIE